MSYFEYVNCPYCNEEVNCMNIEFDGCDKVDHECSNCEKEFEIEREWYPSYSTNEINYYECEVCGIEDRDDNMFRQKDNEYLCRSCYFKQEIEKLKIK